MNFYFRLDSNIKNITELQQSLILFSYLQITDTFFHAIIHTTGRGIKMNHNFVIIFVVASIRSKRKKFNFNDVCLYLKF